MSADWAKRHAEAAAKYGQRAFVGKVCMDRNSPAHYVETTADSLRDTAHFCEEVLAMGDPLITPILTPRYLQRTAHAHTHTRTHAHTHTRTHAHTA
jgi:cytosine/adenosine deaminase-related metal-dependent hydrolase